MTSDTRIEDIDHIEFYVGNAKQSAHYYQSVMGFDLVAYSGPETGQRDRATYLLQQGKIRLALTTSISSDTEIAEHIHKHGDGVHDVAFETADAKSLYESALAGGAHSVQEPTVLKDDDGEVIKASVKTYGDTIHSFIERKNFKGLFLPHFAKRSSPNRLGNAGLRAVDHIVGNVDWNRMDAVCKFYEQAFGFRQFQSFDDADISTEYSALRSKVMTSPDERIKLPINEPAEGKKKSQIEEYLKFYHGEGVQHIALITADILSTVREMRSRGAEFISVPASYYETLGERIKGLKESVSELKSESILVDQDEHGYMLQIFTKPVEDRPTLFYEVIQRRGSKSFGKGNFKALFEAIERDQAARGNL
ncbi:MAG: 4-hydroxyphenylpyruvate dioxygenase [Rhizobacter sp.]|nr:4-hydroxyphenylpyruvate dioxygenase [Chlorobiales bacterium]